MNNPLAYLGEQLAAWRKAGTWQPLRVLQSESAPESCFDGREVINLASNKLSWTDNASQAEGGGARSNTPVRCWLGRGANDLRNHVDPYVARRAHRAVSAASALKCGGASERI